MSRTAEHELTGRFALEAVDSMFCLTTGAVQKGDEVSLLAAILPRAGIGACFGSLMRVLRRRIVFRHGY